jgi:predicted small metal-binding protein
MKDMHCRDVGMDCDFVAKGSTEAEIMRQAGDHAKQAHNMTLSPEMAQKVQSLIHDENSDAHRQSTARK